MSAPRQAEPWVFFSLPLSQSWIWGEATASRKISLLWALSLAEPKSPWLWDCHRAQGQGGASRCVQVRRASLKPGATFWRGSKGWQNPKVLEPCWCIRACPELTCLVTAPSLPASSAVWLPLFVAELCPFWRRWCWCSVGACRGAQGNLQSPCSEGTGQLWDGCQQPLADCVTAPPLVFRQGRRKAAKPGLEMSLALLPPSFPASLLCYAVSDSSSFPPPCPLLSTLPQLCALMGPQANVQTKWPKS